MRTVPKPPVNRPVWPVDRPAGYEPGWNSDGLRADGLVSLDILRVGGPGLCLVCKTRANPWVRNLIFLIFSFYIYIYISDSGVYCTVWLSKMTLFISLFLFGQIDWNLYGRMYYLWSICAAKISFLSITVLEQFPKQSRFFFSFLCVFMMVPHIPLFFLYDFPAENG